MRAARTHDDRLINFADPALKFDGAVALRKRIAAFVRGIKGERLNLVSEKQIVAWFKSTPPAFVKPGDFVKVRPCADDCGGKTFLGVLIGDVAMSVSAGFDKETGKLTIGRCFYNPAILVPSLQRVVYGMESWWGRIESPDDLREIADHDIDSVWYLQALKHLAGQGADASETQSNRADTWHCSSIRPTFRACRRSSACGWLMLAKAADAA